MRALVQRVSEASVWIDGKNHAAIRAGMLIFLGITHTDKEADAEYLAAKCSHLRMFEDGEGKLNLSVGEIGGGILIVSQFTLFGDTRKGNRPGFQEAAAPEHAEPLYEFFAQTLRNELGAGNVATGLFRAMMKVQLVNDGPVTLMLESK